VDRVALTTSGVAEANTILDGGPLQVVSPIVGLRTTSWRGNVKRPLAAG
jgi:hypothetical protein